MGSDGTSQVLAGEATLPLPSGDAALWSDFAAATTLGAFCRSWLAIQTTMIDGVRAGMVLVGSPDQGPFRPVACWPDARRNLSYLTTTAQEALTKRRGVVMTPDMLAPSEEGEHCEVAYPLEVGNELHGAIVLDVAPKSLPELQQILRQVHWGAGRLESLCGRERLEQELAANARIQHAVDLVAAGLGHERFSAACMGFTTALAAHCRCDRVSIGFTRRGRTVIKAVSNSAEFKQETNLLQAIASAMDEAIDQRVSIVYPMVAPATQARSSIVTLAHEDLSRNHARSAVCTVPLMGGSKPIGAVVLERSADRPFDDEAVQLCQSVAALIGPVFEIHQRDDRWVLAKLADAGLIYVRSLLGPQHVALKVATISVVGVVAGGLFMEGDYRVAAKAVLEPRVQRAAVAPFDGYIHEAPARAGDVVSEGQLLCLLDDRDLKLERLKSLSRAEELRKEYQKAMSEQKASQVEIVRAQLKQVEAEIALTGDQLSRMKVMAPFDGIVVSGDLSKELGSPVEKGKVLFEVAPLDAHRLIVEVDERDIADVRVAQRGALLLSAFPNDAIPFTVDKVTPVSAAKDGRNFFRVEASFTAPHDRLRPGMEGTAKVEIGRRGMVWIWTHQVVDWIRLTVWSWLP